MPDERAGRSTQHPQVGVVFRPSCPPEDLAEVAAYADASYADQLWLWEDCFWHGGTASTAVALARSERIAVGLGLWPVPLRNAAVMAMEIASLARTFPGRMLPVLGHGVLDWMAQVGERVASPMTLLEEHVRAVTALLAGEEVTTEGRYVRLDGVRLAFPAPGVPLLVGGRGPRTVGLAGALGGGVLLDSGLSPDDVRRSLAVVDEAGPGAGFRRVGYVAPGSPEEVADVLASYAAAGLDTVVLVPSVEAPDPRPWLDAVPARP